MTVRWGGKNVVFNDKLSSQASKKQKAGHEGETKDIKNRPRGGSGEKAKPARGRNTVPYIFHDGKWRHGRFELTIRHVRSGGMSTATFSTSGQNKQKKRWTDQLKREIEKWQLWARQDPRRPKRIKKQDLEKFSGLGAVVRSGGRGRLTERK